MSRRSEFQLESAHGDLVWLLLFDRAA
jgi:hypothetical protein